MLSGQVFRAPDFRVCSDSFSPAVSLFLDIQKIIYLADHYFYYVFISSNQTLSISRSLGHKKNIFTEQYVFTKLGGRIDFCQSIQTRPISIVQGDFFIYLLTSYSIFGRSACQVIVLFCPYSLCCCADIIRPHRAMLLHVKVVLIMLMNSKDWRSLTDLIAVKVVSLFAGHKNNLFEFI